MIPLIQNEHIGLNAAVALRLRSTVPRVALVGVSALMLGFVAHWPWAAAWWATYVLLQGLIISAESSGRLRRLRAVYVFSFLTYAVAGLPTWFLWSEMGALGISTATMFLCGMLIQQVVSSLAARKLFWACATPLIGYLIFVPVFAFGGDHLVEGLSVSACGLMLVGYLTFLWSSQQNALEAIESSRQKAEAASKAKTDFLAVMSHELRTPMNAVMGAADLLGRTDLSAEQREHVDMLADGGAALMNILNDVLDLAKIEAGKLDINQTNVDIYEVTRRIAAIWTASARDKGLEVNFEIAPHTPQYVVVDATRIGQIAFNLLANAVKFTPSGSISLKLDGREAQPGRFELIYTVSDSGIGMSAETLKRLFNAFEQADSSISRRFGGTGLGLSISQKLAHMMGGEIEAVSVEGKGSTFTLTLPCAPGVAEREAEEVRLSQDADEGRNPVQILVAEDNPANQRIIDLFLQPIGADVTIVADGQQALAMLEARSFDLVLMDMQMPVMDGLEATRILRASSGPNSDIPVLALTANVMEGHQQACREAGMNGHIAKPIDARVLMTSVFAALDSAIGAEDRNLQLQDCAQAA